LPNCKYIGQTDGRNIVLSMHSMLTRDKNDWSQE